ncbi:hypothetical protein Tco_1397499 [Tanacetum coccineum]
MGGTRIIVGWDPNSIRVMVLEHTSQVLHCFVEPVNGDASFFCSFIYAAVHTNKKPGVVGGLLKKLDRVLGNIPLMTSFPTAYALFLPFMLSDHTLAVFVILEVKANTFKAYKYALKDEESFLKQKAKVQWLNEGDKNSKYFHNVVKGRLNRNRISYMEDLNGNAFHGNEVGEQFVHHFKNVLGLSSKVNPIEDLVGLFSKTLPVSEAEFMIRSVSNDEIKKALLEIDGNKAPDPNGFSAQFCKDSWGVIGNEVCKAVSDFFKNSKHLKEINTTIISLVPKIATPSMVSDFHPIACCNELMRGYHFDRGFAKCAFKVDIQKAYDSVEWDFLACCLKAFGFHATMISWIMSYVTSTSFTINVNGDHIGFLKKRQILRNPSFKYHWICKEVRLTHLCFADDLLLFCHGDSKSASVLMKVLDEFREQSFTFAGRLQLIQSILSSMQVFWASMFILPKSISADIERQSRSFWDIFVKAGVSWAWKKLLRFRGTLKDHIVYKIGDGCNTLLWFDNWHAICPLSSFISRRYILYAGLPLDCKVSDIIKNRVREWPSHLASKFNGLSAIHPPCLVEGKPNKDCVVQSVCPPALLHALARYSWETKNS